MLTEDHIISVFDFSSDHHYMAVGMISGAFSLYKDANYIEPSSSQADNKNTGLRKGVLIGIIVGVCGLILFLVIIFVVCRYIKRSGKIEDKNNDSRELSALSIIKGRKK